MGGPPRLGYYNNYLLDHRSCVMGNVQATAARLRPFTPSRFAASSRRISAHLSPASRDSLRLQTGCECAYFGIAVSVFRVRFAESDPSFFCYPYELFIFSIPY